MTEKKIKQKLKSLLPNFNVVSFETSRVFSCPDLYVYRRCFAPYRPTIPTWVELKQVKSELEKIPFRPGQISEFIRLHKAGARVLVIIYCPHRYYVIPGVNLEVLKTCKRLQELPTGTFCVISDDDDDYLTSQNLATLF